jgi:putative Holliday junction resolvase
MAAKKLLALDIGTRRIGTAIADPDTRLPQPLVTIDVSEDVMGKIKAIIAENDINTLVCGVPRGMEGQDTQQTRYTLDFIDRLKENVETPVYVQDEAGTSYKAEAELNSRGKPYAKADIDKLAAVYILEDFLQNHKENE